MRRPATFTRAVFLALTLPIFAACSDGHDYQAEILSTMPDLSCQGLATASEARWRSTTPGRRTVANSQILTLDEADAVLRHFDAIGYDYEAVRTDQQPVPRIYLAKMPSDMPDMDELNTRKQLFLAAMLPAVLQVNEEIREVRRRLVAIDACEHAGYPPAQAVQDWVARVADHYRTDAQASALLQKIGEIPPSLALAQSAVESGWGTSNPAQSINSLFGQYTEDEAAAAKDKKPALRLASYDNILAAVRAYADNLNTHRAYTAFRVRRLTMIGKGESLDGLELSGKLLAYSTRREDYIQDVQLMIRSNGLAAFDKADFGHPTVEVAQNNR